MTGQYEGGGNFGELTETVEEPRVKRVYLFGEGSEMRIKKENVVNKAKYTFLLTKLKLMAKSTYTKYFELR